MLLGNEIIDVSKDNIIELSLGSSSKGNQRKFYDNETHSYIKEAFYYQGKFWKDAYVEHLAWRLSTMTDTLGITIVPQRVVTLDVTNCKNKGQDISNKRLGCISPDFSEMGSVEWISVYRILHGQVADRGQSYKIFTKLISTIKKLCNIDVTDYLIVMIVFDYLIGNEDRHYNNFGITKVNGEYRVAPLFDFGLGLFEHDNIYNGHTLQEATNLMDGKPFHEDMSRPLTMLSNIGFKDKLCRICEGIRVPNRELFPNELGYEYFVEAVTELRRLCR